jgi:hypothetical protein
MDNIKMYLVEIRWGGVDWIGLAKDRDKQRVLMKVVMNLREMLGNYQVATQLVVSRVMLYSTEFVNNITPKITNTQIQAPREERGARK